MARHRSTLRGLLALGIGLLLAGAALPARALPAPQAQLAGGALGRYRVTGVATREQRTSINAAGASIESVGRGQVEIVASPAAAGRVAALGFTVAPMVQASADLAIDPAYHSYAQMVAEIGAVAAAHQDIVRLFSIGRSTEGRTLWAAKISDNVARDEDEPEVLFVGHYHAREHLTVEMMLYLLHLLVDNYGLAGQEQITRLVDSREIYLIFDMNPDGGEYDTSSGFYQYWRKNRQLNLNGSFGTDLNRNHSYAWGCCGGSSGSPFDETYRGPAPASAPEVQAMQAFVNSRVIAGVQQISVAISFHTFSELVLWPYGHTYDAVPPDMRPDDNATFVKLGQDMAALNGYTPMQASGLYITDGDFLDWTYGTHHIFSFTFEMYPSAFGFEGFYPPGSVIGPQTERNRGAVLYLLEQAACPYAAAGLEAAHCTNGRTNPPLVTWLPQIYR
jgi:murein tripeptide amidase MpaA